MSGFASATSIYQHNDGTWFWLIDYFAAGGVYGHSYEGTGFADEAAAEAGAEAAHVTLRANPGWVERPADGVLEWHAEVEKPADRARRER